MFEFNLFGTKEVPTFGDTSVVPIDIPTEDTSFDDSNGVLRKMKLFKSNKALRSYNTKSEAPIDIPTEDTLSNIIKNDLLYGVGNRPTLPSCFEDEDELKQKGVDPLSDMRHDSWHDASVAMNPMFQRTEQTIEVDLQTDTTSTGDTSKDE